CGNRERLKDPYGQAHERSQRHDLKWHLWRDLLHCGRHSRPEHLGVVGPGPDEHRHVRDSPCVCREIDTAGIDLVEDIAADPARPPMIGARPGGSRRSERPSGPAARSSVCPSGSMPGPNAAAVASLTSATAAPAAASAGVNVRPRTIRISNIVKYPGDTPV